MDELAPNELVADGSLSVDDAAAQAGVSREFLYAEMRRGNLPYVLRGRRRLIPKVGLRAWLAAGLRQAQPTD